MAVQAGDSRIGAESIPCRACHVTSARANTVAHAAPHVEDAWRLPPVDMAWRGKASADLCRQWRETGSEDADPVAELIDHVSQSRFVLWGFAPGAGRAAVPGSVADLVQSLTVWGEAGMPCAGDP